MSESDKRLIENLKKRREAQIKAAREQFDLLKAEMNFFETELANDPTGENVCGRVSELVATANRLRDAVFEVE